MKKQLNIDWDQTPNQKKVEQIRDIDIRGRTYFLNEVMEHAQRIRSMAMFVERGGTLHGRWGVVFMFWAERSKLLCLHEKARQMGMNDEAELLLQVVSATDDAAEILFEDVWTDTPWVEPALADSLMPTTIGP